MLGWLKGRSLRRRTGQQLYEGIVAQARDPALYETCGVPDTMDGRLEMVLLHTVLVLDRLQAEGAAGQRLGQHLMERLVAGIDDALRRIGLGDDSVAPRIKRLAGALAERARDYRAGLRASLQEDTSPSPFPLTGRDQRWDERPAPSLAIVGNTPASRLESAFLEHVFSADPASPSRQQKIHAQRLVAYALRARRALDATSSEDLLAGRLPFPPVIETETGTQETRA